MSEKNLTKSDLSLSSLRKMELLPNLLPETLQIMPPQELVDLYNRKELIQSKIKKPAANIEAALKDRMAAGETFPGLALDITKGALEIKPEPLLNYLAEKGFQVGQAMEVFCVKVKNLSEFVTTNIAQFPEVASAPKKQQVEKLATILEGEFPNAITRGNERREIVAQAPVNGIAHEMGAIAFTASPILGRVLPTRSEHQPTLGDF